MTGETDSAAPRWRPGMRQPGWSFSDDTSFSSDGADLLGGPRWTAVVTENGLDVSVTVTQRHSAGCPCAGLPDPRMSAPGGRFCDCLRAGRDYILTVRAAVPVPSSPAGTPVTAEQEISSDWAWLPPGAEVDALALHLAGRVAREARARATQGTGPRGAGKH